MLYEVITRNMKWEYKNNLIEIDPVKKIATFEKKWTEQGAYDPELELYETIPNTDF